MKNSVNGSSPHLPLTPTRTERTEKSEEALNVKSTGLSGSELVTNREYRVRLLDDVSSARSLPSPEGVAGSNSDLPVSVGAEPSIDSTLPAYEATSTVALRDTDGTTWLETPLGPAFEDGQLDLNKITPEMISSLTPQQRRELTDQLKTLQVDFEAEYSSGEQTQGTESADFYLANFLLGKEGGDKAAAQLFAANPEMLDGLLGSGQPMAPGEGSLAPLVRAISSNLDTVVDDMRSTNPDGEPWETRELEGLGTLMALDMEAGLYQKDEFGHITRRDPNHEDAAEIALRYTNALGARDDTEIGAFSGVMLNGLFKFFEETGLHGRDQGAFFQTMAGLLASGAAIASPVASFVVTLGAEIAGPDGAGSNNSTQFLGRLTSELKRSWAVQEGRGEITREQQNERETWFEIGLGQYIYGYD
ncbi:MAG: hypothetical protein WC314_05315 [Vulcanimicrobiota bacterium]